MKPYSKQKHTDKSSDFTIGNQNSQGRNTPDKPENLDGQTAGNKFGQCPSDKGKRAVSLMDTELSDAQIGHAVGLSRERVGQLRKKSGRPPSTHGGERCSTFTEEKLGLLIRELQGHKPLTQIAREIETNENMIRSICSRFDINTANRTTYRLLTKKHHSLKVTSDEFLAFFRKHLHEPNVRSMINRHFGLSNACAYLRVKRMYRREQITDEEYAIMGKNSRKRTNKKGEKGN